MSKDLNKRVMKALVSVDKAVDVIIDALAPEDSPENVASETPEQATAWLRKVVKFRKQVANDLVKRQARTAKLLGNLDAKIKAAAKELHA